jgi:hypothetical protein
MLNKMREQALTVLKFAYMMPFASAIQRFFIYDINEDRMRHVVEKELSNHFSIKYYQSWSNVLTKLAEDTSNNYEDRIINDPTDKNIHDMYDSGLTGKISNTIKNIANVYLTGEKKHLSVDQSEIYTTDKDEQDSKMDIEIQSNSASRMQIANKAINYIIKTPVDKDGIRIGIMQSFQQKYTEEDIEAGFGINKAEKEMLKIIEIIQSKYISEMHIFLEDIVGSYLYKKPDQTLATVRTPKFMKVAYENIFNSSYNKDEYVIEIRDYLNKFAELSEVYRDAGTRTIGKVKNAIYMYYIYIIFKSVRNGI